MKSLLSKLAESKKYLIALITLIAVGVIVFLSYFPELLTLVLVGIFIIAPVFRIHASFVLWRAYHYSKEHSLPTGAILERLFIASSGSISVTILAMLGFLRIALNYVLPTPIGPTLTAISLILLILPSFVWEYMYLTGRLER